MQYAHIKHKVLLNKRWWRRRRRNNAKAVPAASSVPKRKVSMRLIIEGKVKI